MTIPWIYWLPIGVLALCVALALNLELSVWFDKYRAKRKDNES